MLIRKLEIQTIIDDNSYTPNEKEWIVYGHSDILKTEVISNSTNDNDKGIESIYNDSLDYSGEFQQSFFLFSQKDDKMFWSEAQRKYFCAVYFITLSSRDYKKIEDDKENIMLYETLDNYDLIVLCYGNSINEIELNMYNLFRSNEIHVRDIYKMYMTYSKILTKNTSIDCSNTFSVQIQIIIKDGNKFDSLKVEESLKKYSACKIYDTNGSKNVFIFLENITIEDLFSLYTMQKGNEGIFAINSNSRKEAIYSTSLKFLFDDKQDHSYIKQNTSMKLSNNADKDLKVSKKFDEYFNDFNHINIDSFYKTQLQRIVFSMYHVLEYNLPDYCFISLYFSLKKFLSKLGANNSISEYPEIETCIKYFIEAAREIINVSDATQIGHYPIQTYIAKEILTPSQLIAFYSSFLWKFNQIITKIESDSQLIKPSFIFFITPSLDNNVLINGLFLSDECINDRLLLVRIPMKYFYNPSIMIFSLCHEASHYCGENVRCRKKELI